MNCRLPIPDIFTASDPKLLQNCNCHGVISYTNEMPCVFHLSKINLNISLRSITSGIPLRCLDILGTNGFPLTNYQPELAEFFIPDEDFVMYESEDDFLQKIEYYLSHEAERKEISYNGWKKVNQNFSYEKTTADTPVTASLKLDSVA
ncbi:glycosyltransferase family protein [Roseburia zhanii]|nr:glycosyltransferase [Roseburia zhanii]